MENETSINHETANGIKSDVISRKKVYFVAFRKHQDLPSQRKIFANKEDALIHWQEMGKDKYSYWEEYIYGL